MSHKKLARYGSGAVGIYEGSHDSGMKQNGCFHIVVPSEGK